MLRVMRFWFFAYLDDSPSPLAFEALPLPMLYYLFYVVLGYHYEIPLSPQLILFYELVCSMYVVVVV